VLDSTAVQLGVSWVQLWLLNTNLADAPDHVTPQQATARILSRATLLSCCDALSQPLRIGLVHTFSANETLSSVAALYVGHARNTLQYASHSSHVRSEPEAAASLEQPPVRCSALTPPSRPVQFPPGTCCPTTRGLPRACQLALSRRFAAQVWP
jgi:hypothetical protein